MPSRLKGPVARWCAVAGGLWLAAAGATAQERFTPSPPIAGCPSASREFFPCAKPKAAAFEPPRLPDGTPDMQGA